MRTTRRGGLALLGLVVLSVVCPPAAGAQVDDEPRDAIVVITGRADVLEGQTVETVLIADGPAIIDGTVEEAVVALNGDVLVRGTVREAVIATNGDVTIDGGRVEGDVVARRRPVLQNGGVVEGSWERWDAQAFQRGLGIGSWVLFWLAMTISTLVAGVVLYLLAPRVVAAAQGAARAAVGPVLGWGVALAIGLPVLAVLLLVTLVGLPLGFALLGALGLLYLLAYVTAAWIVGQRVAPRAAPLLAFAAGWAILRVLALVPVLGGLAGLAAVVVGFGALAVAGRRAGRVPTGAPPQPGPAVPAAGAA
jgi:hypothetical protein